MAALNQTLYANAMVDAKLLMGRDDRLAWRADEDPLAWWCAVELLVSYARGEKSRLIRKLLS